MLDFLASLANAWPLSFAIVGCTIALAVNRRFKQAMDNDERVKNLQASQSVVVKQRTDY